MIGVFILGMANTCHAITEHHSTHILHHSHNAHGEIWVYENDTERCLSFDRPYQGSRQSCLLLTQTDHLALDYQKMILSALFFNTEPPHDILMIGLGGGTLARALLGLLPEAHLDIVEINPDIPAIAQQFFLFKPSEKTRIFLEKSEDYIQRIGSELAYDLIFVDAFNKDYIPPAFLTFNFVTKLKKHLKPNGVIAVNTFKSSKHYDLETHLYEKTFGTVYNLIGRNRIIIAKKGNIPSIEKLQENARRWDNSFQNLGIPTKSLLDPIQKNN